MIVEEMLKQPNIRVSWVDFMKYLYMHQKILNYYENFAHLPINLDCWMVSRWAFCLQVNIKGKHGRTALYLAAEGLELCHQQHNFLSEHKLFPITINVLQHICIFSLQEGIYLYIHICRMRAYICIFLLCRRAYICIFFLWGRAYICIFSFAGGHIFIVKLLLQHPDIDVNSRF